MLFTNKKKIDKYKKSEALFGFANKSSPKINRPTQKKGDWEGKWMPTEEADVKSISYLV